METVEAVRGRKSIRAFLDKPVPKEIVAQILEASRWAPSGSNRQPWRVTVFTGERRAELVARVVERARAAERTTTTSPPRQAVETLSPERRRRDEHAARLCQEGATSLRELVLGSNRFYGAPVVVVVSHSAGRSYYAHDVAIFVSTMLLVAHDVGLGTCWVGIPLAHSEAILHESLELPEEEQISAIVALGYPDPDAPINAYRSSRAGIEEFVRWVGYD